jgi:Transposase DDE domain group 1
VVWFLRETCKRLPQRAVTKLRADSGFYSKAVVQWCEAHGVLFSITADQTEPLLAAITAVPERCWRPLPEYEVAEVTELHYQPTGWIRPYRYVVKREVAETKAGDLYWKYHATVTNEEVQSAREVVVWHLQHAAMENAIKEHKSRAIALKVREQQEVSSLGEGVPDSGIPSQRRQGVSHGRETHRSPYGPLW